MATIRGILVKPNEPPKEFSFELNSYKDYYPVLDCDIFEIAVRKFGNNYYDICVDEEGLLKCKEPAIFTFDNDVLVEMLVGNCFICKHNLEGDTISLTDEEIKEVMANIRQGVLCCEL